VLGRVKASRFAAPSAALTRPPRGAGIRLSEDFRSSAFEKKAKTEEDEIDTSPIPF
jgi:hypothetical protein